jgi:O-acetyl-ADP-ribose deacetylase (regulator of RNase III)
VLADITGNDPAILYYVGLRDALAKLLTIPLYHGALPRDLAPLLSRRAVSLDEPAPEMRIRDMMQKLRSKSDEDSSPLWCGIPNMPTPMRMPVPLGPEQAQKKHLWAVPASTRTRLGIYTGDIGQVRDVQVVVNSENTLMEMGRVYDPGVSAIIRARGADWDVGGKENNDDVYRALLAQTAGKTIRPGDVFITDVWGALARQGVKRIAHVAAVEPRSTNFGSGYREVANLGECVTNVLIEVARKGRYKSILFPLMGSGNARGNVSIIAETLIYAALAYLKATPASAFEEILFSTYTDLDLDVCTATLNAIGNRIPGG